MELLLEILVAVLAFASLVIQMLEYHREKKPIDNQLSDGNSKRKNDHLTVNHKVVIYVSIYIFKM